MGENDRIGDPDCPNRDRAWNANILNEEFLVMQNVKIVIKGAGEMATGIAHRLFMANLTSIVMTEIPEPVCVRRTVAFSEAVYEWQAKVEGIEAKLIKDRNELDSVWE